HRASRFEGPNLLTAIGIEGKIIAIDIPADQIAGVGIERRTTPNPVRGRMLPEQLLGFCVERNNLVAKVPEVEHSILEIGRAYHWPGWRFIRLDIRSRILPQL